jgi:serine/threonine protein kinase
MLATFPSSVPPELHPGYRLTRFLGSGGFGAVWSADNEEGESVALKFLHCRSKGHALQELRSIQIVRPLRHPNLIDIHRVWAAREYLVVAMELADGSLADLLEIYQEEADYPIPASHLLPLLTPVAESLDYLNAPEHLVDGRRVGIQHCDVSPSNLLLFGEIVKLSDFSLASVLASSLQPHQPSGKPDYAAPEVFQGHLSSWTDQYALAVTYCKLRTGRLPFPDSPSTFERTYTRPTPDLAGLKEEERPIIARALASQPQDRWDSCRELIARLAEQVALGRSTRGGGPRAERRAAVRQKPASEASCRFLTAIGKDLGQVRIQDVSSGGLRLLIASGNCPFEKGKYLSLVLVNEARAFRRLVRMRVVHRSVRSDGNVLLGGTFEDRLSPEDLRALAVETGARKGRPGSEGA